MAPRLLFYNNIIMLYVSQAANKAKIGLKPLKNGQKQL